MGHCIVTKRGIGQRLIILPHNTIHFKAIVLSRVYFSGKDNSFLFPSVLDAPKSITDRCTFQPLQEITTPKPEEPTKGFIGESKLHITYNNSGLCT